MTDQSMPSTYETRTTTTSGPRSGIGFHPEYLKTIRGILKVIECIVSFVVFICTVATNVYWPGAGWVYFVSLSSFVTVLIWLILYVLGCYGRVAGPWSLIEFIYYIVFTVFFLIAGIVAAAKGAYAASIGAAAFFAFAATAVYGVDTFFQFREWRTGQTEMTTTTTTTTSQNVEAGKATY